MPRAGERVTARELLVLVAGACLLSVVMHWPLVLHLGADIPKDLGDPLAESWQVGLGRPRPRPPAAPLLPVEPVLAASRHPGVLRRAGRVRAGGPVRVGPARGGVPLRPALPVRLRAGVRRRLPAGARARARAGGRGGRRGGVRVRALPPRAGRPHAGDLERRHPARAGPRCARATGCGGRAGWSPAGRSPPGSSRSASRSASRSPICSRPLAADRRRSSGCGAAARASTAGSRSRPSPARVLFAAVGFALSRPYLRVADDHPAARRTPATVEAYSGPPWIFLVAPDENLVWGGATAPLRDGLENIPEKTLFPGLVILVLAIAGLSSAALSALAAARARSGGGGGLDPCARVPGGRRAAVAVPARLRRPARMAGDQGPGQARDALVAGTGAARRGGRPAGDAGRRGAQGVPVGRRRPRSPRSACWRS